MADHESLVCPCTTDRWTERHCRRCDDTGWMDEWQCSDCQKWFTSAHYQPDEDCWEVERERYCPTCAAGQKLDAVTYALRKLAEAVKPACIGEPHWYSHKALVEQANLALQMAGEEPI